MVKHVLQLALHIALSY